jgi:hypothetical protein
MSANRRPHERPVTADPQEATMAAFGWNLVYGGKTPPPGEVVRPGERLSWPRTVGLGAQHVVAMFGATFSSRSSWA